LVSKLTGAAPYDHEGVVDDLIDTVETWNSRRQISGRAAGNRPDRALRMRVLALALIGTTSSSDSRQERYDKFRE
jgi:hypothetical protein